MANNCTGDCLKCSFQQQVYCSAQRTYAMMENQKAIVERLDNLEASMSLLTAKNDIINPLEDYKAQNPGGAENRPEKTV